MTTETVLSPTFVWIAVAVATAATLPTALGFKSGDKKTALFPKALFGGGRGDVDEQQQPERMTTPRGLVPTKFGQMHYTAVNLDKIGKNDGGDDTSLLPIVAFHMSPRSVDEYKEIMIEYNNHSDEQNSSTPQRPFVAIDELGYGASDNPTESCSLDEIADCCLEVMDALQIDKCIVAGSLMGCYLALSLAARYPHRIAAVVCSNLYYFPLKQRQEALQKQQEQRQQQEQLDESRRRSNNITNAIPDSWELRDDGSHINDIFPKRSSWLTKELNTRCTLDNLHYNVKRRERYQQGIAIQDGPAFALGKACAHVTCPVLCVQGQAAHQFLDAIGMQMSDQLDEALKLFDNQTTTTKPRVVTLKPPGSSINMLNENAPEWVETVEAFCQEVSSQR